MRRRHGFTLIEIATVLALLGVLMAVAMPPLVGWRDGLAVRAARDDLATALARARIAAVATGGAALVVDPAAGRSWIRTPAADGLEPVDLRERYRVEVDVGGADAVEVRFDALGIGRLANRRIAIRRGRARAGLTISAYGRARRW